MSFPDNPFEEAGPGKLLVANPDAVEPLTCQTIRLLARGDCANAAGNNPPGDRRGTAHHGRFCLSTCDPCWTTPGRVHDDGHSEVAAALVW